MNCPECDPRKPGYVVGYEDEEMIRWDGCPTCNGTGQAPESGERGPREKLSLSLNCFALTAYQNDEGELAESLEAAAALIERDGETIKWLDGWRGMSGAKELESALRELVEAVKAGSNAPPRTERCWTCKGTGRIYSTHEAAGLDPGSTAVPSEVKLKCLECGGTGTATTAIGAALTRCEAALLPTKEAE